MTTSLLVAQVVTFRSGIFLHHSTGGNIWGPNGSNTSVPEEITAYNTAHGFSGTDLVSLDESWFPVSLDNEWSTWHEIFEQTAPENLCTLCNTNPIIMIKSCFPSSNIYEVGQPSDTLNPTYKSVVNYKWHWRHILNVMKTHLNHFFVIWTNAPLVYNDTDPTQAMLSHQFCKWAKDTLAQGLDPVFGAFPPNVYVFDYFHKVANAQGFLNPLYAVSSWDSHPNATATQLVAPQLVNESFDASLDYEFLVSLKSIDGILYYDNSQLTPIVNRKVYLILGCCNKVDSTYTDADGHFIFQDIDPGNYIVKPVDDEEWGGVNADDALALLKHFVGFITLTGLREIAGNLDDNHFINSIDAMMAAKRYVGLISTFPIGNWSYESCPVELSGDANITVSIKSICNGDVNGSFIP